MICAGGARVLALRPEAPEARNVSRPWRLPLLPAAVAAAAAAAEEEEEEEEEVVVKAEVDWVAEAELPDPHPPPEFALTDTVRPE